MVTSVDFKAKLWLRYDQGDCIENLIVFCDELDDPTLTMRPSEDWVSDHLRECMDDEQRREMLGLPQDEHHYQVLFSGTLSGWHSSGPDGDDYDEEMDIDDGVKFIQLPDSYYGSDLK
jgi:hypothetical protein